MKAKIDKNLCTGCSLCIDTCPEVFQMEDAVAKVICDIIPKTAESAVRDAADNCPVEAIALDE